MSGHMPAVGLSVIVREVPYKGRFWATKDGEALATVAFLLASALLQVLDAAATWLGMQLGGSEANPVMAALFIAPGPALFYFVKGLVVILLVGWAAYIAWMRDITPGMRRGVQALTVFFLGVLMINVTIISKHIYGLPLY